jgi:hypothetical protein
VSTEYSLTVTNNSTMFQDLCLYQKPVDLGVPDAVSLAWLCVPAWPRTTATFAWSLDYAFVWARTGSLKPGIQFETQALVAADPDDLKLNQIQFDYVNGIFAFIPGPATGGPQPGSLYIRELGGIPVNTAAVGIGMSEAATFAVMAHPDTQPAFTPHPSYWITAGTFLKGQVIDVELIADEAEVVFEDTDELLATLNPDNTWTVTDAG